MVIFFPVWDRHNSKKQTPGTHQWKWHSSRSNGVLAYVSMTQEGPSSSCNCGCVIFIAAHLLHKHWTARLPEFQCRISWWSGGEKTAVMSALFKSREWEALHASLITLYQCVSSNHKHKFGVGGGVVSSFPECSVLVLLPVCLSVLITSSS